MQIGPHTLETPLIVAPMAGVTDRPFRELCLRLGAGMAVSEMLLANPDVWDTQKTRMRMDYSAEGGLRLVQIAGADPEMMAFAARYNVEQGAQIVDINMGCPAKKVNKKLAGSALLRHPNLVRAICRAVVDAVDVPVTLKSAQDGIRITAMARRWPNRRRLRYRGPRRAWSYPCLPLPGSR